MFGSGTCRRRWLLAGLVLAGAGCCPCPRIICQDPSDPPPSLAEVCYVVNANSARATTVRATEMQLEAGGRSAEGMLALEGKRRLHLRADHTLGQVFDCGSNDQMFWVWSGLGEYEPMRYCRWADVAGRPDARTGLLLGPDLIRDALGLTVFDSPPLRQFLEVGPQRLIVVTFGLRDGGPFLIRKTILNRCTLHVIRQELYDATGRLAASADLAEHFVHEPSAVILPGLVTIELPKEERQVILRLGSVEIGAPLEADYWEPAVPFDARQGAINICKPRAVNP